MVESRWLRVLRAVPYADRRDVAAGYAMGGAAAATAVLWYALALGLYVLGGAGPLDQGLVALALGGSVVVAPLAVACSFVVGTLLWRRYAPSLPAPRRGALLGAATALVSLSLGAVGLGLLALVFGLFGDTGTSGAEVLSAATWIAAFGFGWALALVGWLVVPIGALAGRHHEREVGRAPSDAAVRRSIE